MCNIDQCNGVANGDIASTCCEYTIIYRYIYYALLIKRLLNDSTILLQNTGFFAS